MNAMIGSISIEKKDRSFPFIALAVILTHVCFLYYGQISSESFPIVKPTERMVVKTIHLKELKDIKAPQMKMAPPVIKEIEPEPQVESPPIVKEETVPPIEQAPEVVVEKVQTPQPKPIAKKSPAPSVKKVTQPVKAKPKEPIAKTPVPKVKKKEAVELKKIAPVEIKKVEPKKVTPEKPKPDPEAEARKAKQQELLAKAQQSIAKIDKPRANIPSAKASAVVISAIPNKIESLHIDALPSDSNAAPLNAREMGYRDELAGRLKLLLKLPEHGAVKLKLTLERSGKVANIAIVNSLSSANRAYIEKALPALSFPSFGSNFGDLPQYTFVIALSNEIN